MSIVLRFFVALFLLIYVASRLAAQGFSASDPGGGSQPGGEDTSPLDFVVVDYDDAGVVINAYLPGVGFFDGPDASGRLELAISLSFDASRSTSIMSTINGQASEAALAARTIAILNGDPIATGYAVVSTTDASVAAFGIARFPITASGAAFSIETGLLSDGFSLNSAVVAVRAVVLGGGKGKIPSIVQQQYIYIVTTDGDVYYPRSGEELQEALEQIESDGDIIKNLIIKGHGSSETIEIGRDGDILIVDHGDILIGNVDDPNVSIDITNVLNNTTNEETHIGLRGCSTAPLAEALDGALGGDPAVSGAPIPILGIPYSPWTIGPWYTY